MQNRQNVHVYVPTAAAQRKTAEMQNDKLILMVG